MAKSKFLDFTGMSVFWNKIKDNTVSKDSVGTPSGVASLDDEGKVPLTQLPDDVVHNEIQEGVTYVDLYDTDGEELVDILPVDADTLEGHNSEYFAKAEDLVATNDQTPTYTVASSNAELTSGEKLSVAFGKIAKAVKSLISHIGDTVGHITAAERTAWNGKAGTNTATTSANGLMSKEDKTKLDSYSSASTYTTEERSSGYYKINITSEEKWMLCFTIRVYQGYRATDIMVGGYNYGDRYWYSPSAVLLGDSSKSNITVSFGYNAQNKLWVAIPAGDYTGLNIFNVTNGYQQVESVDGLFDISYVTSLTGTTQSTITAQSPIYKDDVVSIAQGGTGATSLSGITKMLCDSQPNTTPKYVIGLNDSYQGNGYSSMQNLRNSMGLGNTTGALPIANGGTGATTAAGARENIGAAASSHNHTILSYGSQVTTDGDIDNLLEANKLKANIWTTTSSPGVSNGIILSGGYSSNSYGFQLAFDDDPSYFMALRQKGSSGWYSWKKIPMGDGTGASGTWGISISGNAATASSVAWGNVSGKPSSFTPSSHNQAASTISAGTFAGQVVAPASTSYTTNHIRNTVFTTSDPGAGVSTSYANGSIISVYE